MTTGGCFADISGSPCGEAGETVTDIPHPQPSTPSRPRQGGSFQRCTVKSHVKVKARFTPVGSTKWKVYLCLYVAVRKVAVKKVPPGHQRGREVGVAKQSESPGWRLCSPRLHLTLYEPMKWLNHFTADVYNAIDPYLFITPAGFSLVKPEGGRFNTGTTERSRNDPSLTFSSAAHRNS
ncbi:hypothetical protein KM043_008494 [Ampulex compressa]|nr:hypothetical protein KM043_008494 [Ampulex compressa]